MHISLNKNWFADLDVCSSTTLQPPSPQTGYNPDAIRGLLSNLCAAFTSFWRARNNFTFIVFSFIPVIWDNSST